jgi:hypothetical protein
MALKALLCFGNDESPQHQSVLRAIHTINSPKNYTRLLGGLSPIHLACQRGVQGLMWGTRGHFCQWWQWSAMVVLVNVGHWRLPSDRTTVGIVKIVYGSIFLFLRRSPKFLTSDPAANENCCAMPFGGDYSAFVALVHKNSSYIECNRYVAIYH